MLRALPFQTIGDIARHGLELHVYCPSCYASRIVATDDERGAIGSLPRPAFTAPASGPLLGSSAAVAVFPRFGRMICFKSVAL